MMITGCVKNEVEEMEAREKKIIEQYLADNNISADTKTEGGIYFIETVAGTGQTPVKDDNVFINYVGRYLEDGLIRETSYDSLKSDWPAAATFEDLLYGPVKVIYGYSMPGINEALSLMKEGGRATVIIPSDKANYDFNPLMYELELLRVVKNPVSYEDSVMNIYKDKYFGDESRVDTSQFVWLKITETSDSEVTFGTGDTLYFNFTGKIVDGFGDSVQASRVFDSNTGEAPLKYLFGQTKVTSGQMLNQNLIPDGLKLALDSIQNEVKASVLMKYDQAFEEDGLVHPVYNYIIIPRLQTVVYDIEVVDIRPGAGK
jgi:FKBP-type peptidyl-prolyl cis-trans isomerase 2